MKPHDDPLDAPPGDAVLPVILGHRGSPRESPENTLASLERAIEHGLDGVEYDLQRTRCGEALLLHDDTLDRTTNVGGPVSDWTLPDLAHVDAGGWFHRDFLGETLPTLEEALDLFGTTPQSDLMHMIELKDPLLVPVVVKALEARRGRARAIVASFHRSVVLEAKAAGLRTMLLAVRAEEGDRRFVRDEGLDAHGVSASGWNTDAGREEWSCERWAWSVDSPLDLLQACRRPLTGFNTNEPRRALAVRELVHLAPNDRGAYPVQVPTLEVVPGSLPGTRGEWCGRWQVAASVRNPFDWKVEAEVDARFRGGAYEVTELPRTIALEPGEQAALEFGLAGGSWAPGSDPVLVARLRWEGRELELDAPLTRVRSLALGEGPRRVMLLRERPDEADASMVVRRQGSYLVCSIENNAGLEDARAVVHLAGETRRGTRGVRIRLQPEHLADLGGLELGPLGLRKRSDEGLRFSCGIEGRLNGVHRVRRWAGGLPDSITAGHPGRLLLRGRA